MLCYTTGLDVAAITKRVVETLRFREDDQFTADVVHTAALEAATSQVYSSLVTVIIAPQLLHQPKYALIARDI